MKPNLFISLSLIAFCWSEAQVLRNQDATRRLDESCVALIQAVDMGPGLPDEEHLACETPSGMVYRVKNASKKELDHVKKNVGKVNTETVLQFASAAHINEETQEIESDLAPTLVDQNRRLSSTSRNLATVTGNKSILVVRVVTSDNKAPSASRLSLSNSVFSNNADGMGADAVSIKTQYAACSHGKLNIVEASDRNGNGANIRNGSVEVKVNLKSSSSDGNIRTAVTSQLKTLFGVNAWNLADHVMYCLPPLSSDWGIAYAYIDHWNSVYSNEWCRYLSTQMHEIGHNMNLAHSGESAEYDDQSGMMGYSYDKLDGPLMCFNAAKSWQLGWYRARHLTINLNNGFSGNLGSIVHDDLDPSPAIIKINNSGSTTDHYITFNWQYGMNSGTVEGGNMVMIVETGSEGLGYSKSFLRRKQDVGSYTYTLGGSNVHVTVNSINTSTGYANVDICYGTCGRPPTSAPTREISSKPSRQPSTKPSMVPTVTASENPTGQPTSTPSTVPTVTASKNPTGQPTSVPSRMPTSTPSTSPTGQPSYMPSEAPSRIPTSAPTSSVIMTVHSFIKAELEVSCPFNKTLVEESLTSEMLETLNQQGIGVEVVVTILSDVSCSDRRHLGSLNVESLIETYLMIRDENFLNITADNVVRAVGTLSNVSGAVAIEQPSSAPSSSPSSRPSTKPSHSPSDYPSISPSTSPTMVPSDSPSGSPSKQPSPSPSDYPSSSPSTSPTMVPSISPSKSPTHQPSPSPTDFPSTSPSTIPTRTHSASPSRFPTETPSFRPTKQPSHSPTANPTIAPTPSSWQLCRTAKANQKANNCRKISGCTWCTSCSVASGQCRPITPSPTASPTSKPTASPSDFPSVSVVATVSVTLKLDLDVTCPSFNPSDASTILDSEALKALQQDGVTVETKTSVTDDACSNRRRLSTSVAHAVMQVDVFIRDGSVSDSYDDDFIVESVSALNPGSFSIVDVEIIESPSASPSFSPSSRPTPLTAPPSAAPTIAPTPTAYKLCRTANAMKKEKNCSNISVCIWTNNSCYHRGSRFGEDVGSPVTVPPVTPPVNNSCLFHKNQNVCKSNKACKWKNNECIVK